MWNDHNCIDGSLFAIVCHNTYEYCVNDADNANNNYDLKHYAERITHKKNIFSDRFGFSPTQSLSMANKFQLIKLNGIQILVLKEDRYHFEVKPARFWQEKITFVLIGPELQQFVIVTHLIRTIDVPMENESINNVLS